MACAFCRDLGEPNRRFPWVGALEGRRARVGRDELGGLGASVFFLGQVRARGARALADGSARKPA